MTWRQQQKQKAKDFLAMHTAPQILILANAWDVVSARLYETEGFKAIGTTSAGVAATLGFPDGERMGLEDNAAVVRRIVEHVNVPVSADAEAGYATTPEGVAITAKKMLEAGAVGMNLEDCTGNPNGPLYGAAVQVEKIRAIREIASSQDIPLVVNARTDVFLQDEGLPLSRLKQTIERGNAYREAGADCIFVPDLGDLQEETIMSLVKEIDAPVNIIVGAGSPPLAELEQIGVARVSFGPRAMRAGLALIRRIAREWKETGTYDAMNAEMMSYAEINRMLERGGRC